MAGKRKLHYGWIIAAVAFTVMFIAQGMVNSTFGLYQVPVTTDTGISRAQFSSIATFRFATAMVCSIFFGTLAKKLGLRRLCFTGLLFLTAALIVLSVSSRPWSFYLGGILLGVGCIIPNTSLVSSLLNNWFVKNRGFILGLTLCASGLGGSIFNQVVSGWITGGGWRHAYRTAACFAFAAAIAAVILMRNTPEEKGLLPVGSEEKAEEGSSVRPAAELKGTVFKDALKTPLFYLIMLCAFFIGFINNPVYVSVPAQIVDKGFTSAQGATASSIIFISIAVSKVCLGRINDRIGVKATVCIGFIANFAGLALLLTAGKLAGFYIFAAIFGLSVPLENMIMTLIIGSVFGRKEYPSFIGVAHAMVSAGVAVGNPLFGLCYERFGNYRYMIALCLVIAVLCFITIMRAITKSEKVFGKD